MTKLALIVIVLCNALTICFTLQTIVNVRRIKAAHDKIARLRRMEAA